MIHDWRKGSSSSYFKIEAKELVSGRTAKWKVLGEDRKTPIEIDFSAEIIDSEAQADDG